MLQVFPPPLEQNDGLTLGGRIWSVSCTHHPQNRIKRKKNRIKRKRNRIKRKKNRIKERRRE